MMRRATTLLAVLALTAACAASAATAPRDHSARIVAERAAAAGAAAAEGVRCRHPQPHSSPGDDDAVRVGPRLVEKPLAFPGALLRDEAGLPIVDPPERCVSCQGTGRARPQKECAERRARGRAAAHARAPAAAAAAEKPQTHTHTHTTTTTTTTTINTITTHSVAGYFQLNRTYDAHMFYLYYAPRAPRHPLTGKQRELSDAEKAAAPVVLWMTGGPGW
jgi:hypothetical protein